MPDLKVTKKPTAAFKGKKQEVLNKLPITKDEFIDQLLDSRPVKPKKKK